MEIRIKSAENGYIVSEYLSEEDFTTVDYVYEKLVDAVRHVSNYYDTSGRYDEKRIYVIEAPGDKNDKFTSAHADVIWGELEVEL